MSVSFKCLVEYCLNCLISFGLVSLTQKEMFFLGIKKKGIYLVIKILLDIKGKVILIEEVMCIPFPSRNIFETL